MRIKHTIIRWSITTLVILSLTACKDRSMDSSRASKSNPSSDLLTLSHATVSSTLRPTHTSTSTPVIPTPTIVVKHTFTPTPTATISTQMCSPLAGFPLEELPRIVSDGYHPPPPRSDERHEGVDFVYSWLVTGQSSILGVPITSVLPGKVAAAISDSFPYGNVVIVETPFEYIPHALIQTIGFTPDQSLYVLYAHMQEMPMVKLGQAVISCQPVGRVGATGNTLAPHLHLETRHGPAGAYFTVMSAFLEGTTPEQRANYKRWRTGGEFLHFDPMLLLAPETTPTLTPQP
jgi:murein DD-endopeptidase MepM/ murein hydrolase activator NlpD